MRTQIRLYLFLLTLSFNLYAQLPYNFTKMGQVNDGGAASDVALGSDDIVFLANWDDGLRAYKYSDGKFNSVAHVNNGCCASQIAIGLDGTVFIANMLDGLRSYILQGDSLLNTAHIKLGNQSFDEVHSVIVGGDNTVFIGSGSGIFAYEYNGNSFSKKDQAFPGHRIYAITAGENNTVYGAGSGMFAVTYKDGTFSSLARINSNSIYEVESYQDNVVFFGSSLRVYSYRYESDSLIFIDEADIVHPWDLKVTDNGTIFMARYEHGLSAYTHDENTFINVAHIDVHNATRVDIGPKGTIFLADWIDGLIAYNYSGFTTSVENSSNEVLNYYLSQNYPNPFNAATTIEFTLPKYDHVQIHIYNDVGHLIETLINRNMQPGNYKVEFNASNLSSGIYFIKIKMAEYQNFKKMLLIK